MQDEKHPLLDSGELTEREAKLAHGLALVQAGIGYQAAAKRAKVNSRSLYVAAQKLYVGVGTRESALEAAEKRIEAQVVLIAEASGERVINALADGEEVGKNDAVLYGIASDKIMRLRGLDRQQDRSGSALGQVMERLSSLGLEAEITVRPASQEPEREASEPIDVTPSERG